MKKRKIDRSFLNNRGVNILLSLGIALLIWTIVTVYIDPDQTNRLKGVPVNFEQDSQMYTSLGLDIINDPMAQVTVELAGNGTDVYALTAENVLVYPDYSIVKGPGTWELNLLVRVLGNSASRVTASTSDTVTVVFDTIESKEFTVQVEMDQQITIADGYVLHSTTAAPSIVTVRGPESEVEKIGSIVAKVPASADLENLSTSKIATVTLEVRDVNNQPMDLEFSSLDNSIVDVNLTVYQNAELPLSVNFINYPPNFDLNSLDYTLSQETMVVSGRSSVIQNLTEITVSDFDLSSFQLDKVYQLQMNLPKGVESRDNITTVNLTFNTQGYATKTINVSQIRVINQPANMEIKALDSRISSVTLVGPEEELEALSPNSVVAVVDASDIQIAEGREKLAASIQIPASTTIFATGSYSVECQVSASGAQS